jgi:hypothetical protein
MAADIINKRADTSYKVTLAWWESRKALALLLGSVAAVVGVVAGLAGYKIGSQPTSPPTIVLQLPPGTTITTPTR